MKLLIRGINPEPWTAPSLGVRRKGGRVLPQAYKNENLRGYQEAIRESVSDALLEIGLTLPVFPKGTSLAMTFAFWRQLESVSGPASGGRRTRRHADATNMLKAAEDALQGVLYDNDRHNRHVVSSVISAEPDTEPMLMVLAEVYSDARYSHPLEAWAKALLAGNAVADSTNTVWVER